MESPKDVKLLEQYVTKSVATSNDASRKKYELAIPLEHHLLD